jgi:hypothetical protein
MQRRVSETMRGNRVSAMRLLLSGVIAGVALLSMLMTAQPQTRQRAGSKIEQTPAAVNKRRARDLAPSAELPKPRDAEAAALVLHLLDRYAKNVSKTEIDKRLERALTASGVKRAAAASVMTKFRRIPIAKRQAAFGKWSNVSAELSISTEQYRAAFQRLAGLTTKRPSPWTQEMDGLEDQLRKARPGVTPNRPKPSRPNERPRGPNNSGESLPFLAQAQSSTELPAPLVPVSFTTSAQDDRYRLMYTGLRCISAANDVEGRETDEIYILTVVTDNDGQNVRVERHPNPSNSPYYESVQDGELGKGPERMCWRGTARELKLTVWVVEKDVFSAHHNDPSEMREEVLAITQAAETACAFFDFDGCDWAEDVLNDLLQTVLVGFWGHERRDDSQGVVQTNITANQITRFASQATHDSKERQQFQNNEETTIPFHIVTCHKRGKGHFHVYFKVNRVS